MHRSSDTIATIAAALAKAQVELTNPEKSGRSARSAISRRRSAWALPSPMRVATLFSRWSE
jgi:hypothetical protein